MRTASAKKIQRSCDLCAACVYTWVCLLFGAVSLSEAENLPGPMPLADFQKMVSENNGLIQIPLPEKDTP
jgi:hypothetical protein